MGFLHAGAQAILAGLFVALNTHTYGVEAHNHTNHTVPMADLPWCKLEEHLSPSAVFIDSVPIDYINECLPVFLQPEPQRTMYDLINKPSGLCMHFLACGYGQCDLRFNQTDLSINAEHAIPPKVLFPRIASDVAAAVDFAKNHSVELSVKNSGHSHTGASMKRETLLINMNHFEQYAPTGIEECGDVGPVQWEDIKSDLSNQPCKLAAARGKPAILRVGGGENFDKVYSAVQDWNEKYVNEGGGKEYKYHLVGGAAGTVSPQGWTWSGGLSGTTAGRLFGFGVDQVLQVEMILPSGDHVRFGPSKWADEEGYQHPKTLEVSGVCKKTALGDESSSVWWGTCPEEIDFNELWFAVNGGGGGTYGIVLSVFLQLHYYQGTLFYNALGPDILTSPMCKVSEEYAFGALGEATWKFLIRLMLDPSALGVSEEDSNACAAPAEKQFLVGMWCYGESASVAVQDAWKRFWIKEKAALKDSVPEAEIDKAAGCFSWLAKDKDYASFLTIKEGPHEGHAQDNPNPSLAPPDTVNLIIPKKWILGNEKKMVELLMKYQYGNYWAFGGNTVTAQDQSNSLTAYREAGSMLFIARGIFESDAFYRAFFLDMYDLANSKLLPAFVGGNHAYPNIRGPLKIDWTQPCNSTWSREERDEKCVSLQETVWGTRKLARLEAIKEAIDPNYMLDCNHCVGNDATNEDPLPPKGKGKGKGCEDKGGKGKGKGKRRDKVSVRSKRRARAVRG